ncbi:hypothetical protein [Flagellimonas sp. GZD32]|uniref:hypothetical protein n=1 Tax=Flagellimonas cixiensis TaxID=3228750 RepID=UPI0035C8C15F
MLTNKQLLNNRLDLSSKPLLHPIFFLSLGLQEQVQDLAVSDVVIPASFTGIKNNIKGASNADFNGGHALKAFQEVDSNYSFIGFTLQEIIYRSSSAIGSG